MSNPYSLEGKTALITGASRGLGWATARAMAEAGAHVALNGRDPKTLAARADELAAAGHAASVAAFVVADPEAASAGLAAAADRQGGIDILVSNAGINHREPLETYSVEDWRRIIDTNLTAYFVLARDAGRGMVERGWGRIIVTGSIMGQVARPGLPAYVAAKGGVHALTRALAAELGPRGVTCNAIAPGYIATEMTAPLAADPEFDAMVKRRTPLGRWGRPEEIGAAAAFLASDAASYINGHVLTVDGGLTALL